MNKIMNLKNRPTSAKRVSKAIEKIKKLKFNDVKEGVDLPKLAKKLAKRNLEKVKNEEEESLENE